MSLQVAQTAAAAELLAGDVLLCLKQVIAITGLSRSSIYSHMKAGIFPLQVPVGSRGVRWSLNEVRQWMSGQLTLRGSRAQQSTDRSGRTP
jgi:prophage regulatory protein